MTEDADRGWVPRRLWEGDKLIRIEHEAAACTSESRARRLLQSYSISISKPSHFGVLDSPVSVVSLDPVLAMVAESSRFARLTAMTQRVGRGNTIESRFVT